MLFKDSTWYVIQVIGGREEAARRLINKHVDATTYEEVFVPRYRVSHRVGDKWEYCYPVLTPGYVIVDTRDIGTFELQLHRVPAFLRLLGDGAGFKRLDREERSWLQQWTNRSARIVQGSIGRIDKGKLNILSGPLVGKEADVVRVNRRKRQATIRMTVMGREKEVNLELEIISKTTV